jgi:hypothetical protein
MGRDLRRSSRQTTIRLVIGFFIILLVVGLGLIYLIWGRNAAVSGLICIGLGVFPIGLIWLLLWLLGWIAKKMDRG